MGEFRNKIVDDAVQSMTTRECALLNEYVKDMRAIDEELTSDASCLGLTFIIAIICAFTFILSYNPASK